MYTTNARGILLDIEGTTSSIRFVYDVMFPYVRDHVAEFLSKHWDDAEVRDAVELLASDLNYPAAENWLGNRSPSEQQADVVTGIVGLMDADVKATGLKQLQGLIWQSGFESGRMVAHLYDDVAGCIGRWCESGIEVRIYSSGSIQAQRLFFGHTVAGNLLDRFGGHYDTTTGAKQEAASYEKIARDFDCPAGEILFISDVPAELAAAREAGLQAVLSIRPENKPVDPEHGFDAITSFDEIDCVA